MLIKGTFHFFGRFTNHLEFSHFDYYADLWGLAEALLAWLGMGHWIGLDH